MRGSVGRDFDATLDGVAARAREAPLVFTCRLIEKAWRQGHEVYVHTGSDRMSQDLDELLWSFREDRFIPHALRASDDTAPILIGHDQEPGEHQDVLVNLSGKVPEFFSRFDRVAEIVPLAEEKRLAARENYRFYQKRGYALNYHQINQTAKPGHG